jgi:hypothetical protein
MIIFTIGSISGEYGFVSVYKDYKYMLFAMNESPYPIEVITSKLQPFPEKQAFINAADFENPLVRNFALKATREHFLEEKKEYYDDRQLIQCLAVFKEINQNWNYVHDPKFLEYFAKASESVQHLSGDCDDYSILMYSCIKSIGGKPRIVSTTGHVYPELFIGNENDMERLNYIIKSDLFKNEASGQRLNYHVNERGEVWLNLDYTAKHPGGEFMHPEILAVLEY